MARLDDLRAEVQHCTACELYKEGTQAVFGEGLAKAEVMFVGEQPGDREDREGKPFVGPAGGLLDRALSEAGIVRERVYVTNAVKHFKWRPKGKRRLHQTPRAGELTACKPWLEAELEAVSPEAVVALGAKAAASVFGSKVKVTKDRGRILETPHARIGAVTNHPSAILRLGDEERKLGFAELVEDLVVVEEALRG